MSCGHPPQQHTRARYKVRFDALYDMYIFAVGGNDCIPSRLVQPCTTRECRPKVLEMVPRDRVNSYWRFWRVACQPTKWVLCSVSGYRSCVCISIPEKSVFCRSAEPRILMEPTGGVVNVGEYHITSARNCLMQVPEVCSEQLKCLQRQP